MTYKRVIPRDLFNEANLLKCLGQLVVKLDERRSFASLKASEANPFAGFMIEQSPDDGSISSATLIFMIKADNYRLYRPLNSREVWPLWVGAGWMTDPDFEDLAVFDDEGELSPEFIALIGVGF